MYLTLNFVANAINASLERLKSFNRTIGGKRKAARTCYDDEAIYQRNKFDFMVRQ
jgi:hypothetical protein